jgi:hypothetical protein
MLKWLAAALMLADHVGLYFAYQLPVPVTMALRLLGRLAFPVFAYYTAFGFLRTSNRLRYFSRMLVFGIVTQLMFYAAHKMTGSYTFLNVILTFTLSILFLAFADTAGKCIRSLTNRKTEDVSLRIRGRDLLACGKTGTIFLLTASILGMILILLLEYRYPTDYGIFGILTVWLIYLFMKNMQTVRMYEDKRRYIFLIISFLSLNLAWAAEKIYLLNGDMLWSLMEIFSVFGLLLLFIDKPRKKPGRFEKYFFYVFYPVHITLLMFLCRIMS